MSRSINEVDKIWVAEALGKKRMNGVQDVYATDSTDGAFVQEVADLAQEGHNTFIRWHDIPNRETFIRWNDL